MKWNNELNSTKNTKLQRNKYNTLLNDLCGKYIMTIVIETMDEPKSLYREQYKKKTN